MPTRFITPNTPALASSRHLPKGLPHATAALQVRDPAPMLQAVLRQWDGADIWLFGYASLIWKQEFSFAERRLARVAGWHRALQMWSRVNRGSPEHPGLVFALLSGGSCQGVVFKVAAAHVPDVLAALWNREMPTGVYDPRWLSCKTEQGAVTALAFTLSRSSPNYCGPLGPAQYRQIFKSARGRYGSTLEYAQLTYDSLLHEGINDRALHTILRHANT